MRLEYLATFIVDTQLPVHEKVVLAFLMSLGLFASAAAVVKIAEFKIYDLIHDPSWDLLPAAL